MNESFVREVDEDLRAERMRKFWDRYGKTIIGSALGLILAVSGFVGFERYQEYERAQAAGAFSVAQSALNSDSRIEALESFDALGDTSIEGYRLLSKLQLAGALAAAGDTDEALSVYDRLIADRGISEVYRDYARILSAYLRLDQNLIGEALAALAAEIQPLTASSNPWRASAREILALIRAQEGDEAAATALLQETLTDPDTPPSMRERANRLLESWS